MLDLSALLLLSASQTIGGLVLAAWTTRQARCAADRESYEARIKLRIVLTLELEALVDLCRDHLGRLTRNEQILLPLEPFLQLYHELLPQMGVLPPIEFAQIASIYGTLERLRYALEPTEFRARKARDASHAADLRASFEALIASIESLLAAIGSGSIDSTVLGPRF